MLDLDSREFQSVTAAHFPLHWFRDIPAGWETSFYSPADIDELWWGFLSGSDSDFPRGYDGSVRQRCDLWSANSPDRKLEFVKNEDESLLIIAPAFDGEPAHLYFQRVKQNLSAPLLSVLLDVVRELSRLTDSPRLLSSIVWEDFFVRRESGVNLTAELCPVFAMLRNETPQSDFQIGRYWAGVVAAIAVASGNRWAADFSSYDPLSSKPFRQLLRSMDRGMEISLKECFTELESILLGELDSMKTPVEQRRLAWGKSAIPGGALSVSLMGSLEESHPDRVPELPQRLASRRFSPFVTGRVECEGGAASGSSVLPPEHWFEGSLIEPVNRRLSTPFLKVHPNLSRIRSVLCEEGFTALVGEDGGIPLISLLEAHRGLASVDVLRIGEKVARAFSQFESADFELDLRTPWQIEIQSVDPERVDELLDVWIEESIGDWPAWDVKFRVERPAESFLPACPAVNAWNVVFERMKGKSFPALLIWMLEWKRLVWAAGEGGLESEPLSWDKEMSALFDAAIEHYENSNPSHRRRFLDLIGEGCSAT